MSTATPLAVRSPSHPPDIARVYVWQVPVRVTHWLIALSIVVLSVTGFSGSATGVPSSACS